MRTPLAEITVNGKPVASTFNDRLISVSIVDKEGISSDTIRCELADSRPFLMIPRKGDIIGASLGYRETGVVFFGRYTADDPEVKCLPYSMSVNGKAADMRDELKQQRERNWDDKSVKDIISEIAKDHGLEPAISGSVSAHKYSWFGQEGESDIHVVERLARRHNALFAVKNGKLIFAEKASGQSASGAALPVVVSRPSNIIAGTCTTTFAHRNAFQKVRAHAYNRQKAEREEVDWKSVAEAKPEFHLSEAYADKDEAKNAAKAKARDLKSETIRTSVDVFGDPAIRAGAPFRYDGVRPELDGIEFIIETATHELSKSGYVTKIEAKLGDEDGGKTGSAGKSGKSGNASGGTVDWNSVAQGGAG